MAERQTTSEDNFYNGPMLPPENWGFTHLLDEFRTQLSLEDLSRIKLIFKDIVTEQVETWIELLTILTDKGYITQTDIVYLQKIAVHLDKECLYLETLKYAKKRENDILHFEKNHLIQEPGEEIVEFHVRGQKCSTNSQLDEIRTTIATILMVNKDIVKVANVQPTNSVRIKFILPRMYVKVLEKILKSNMANRFTAPLARKGVDTVYIDDEKYEIQIEDQEDEHVIDQTKYISELQDRLSQTQYQLKKLEEEILSLREKGYDRKGTKRKYQCECGEKEYIDEEVNKTKRER